MHICLHPREISTVDTTRLDPGRAIHFLFAIETSRCHLEQLARVSCHIRIKINGGIEKKREKERERQRLTKRVHPNSDENTLNLFPSCYAITIFLDQTSSLRAIVHDSRVRHSCLNLTSRTSGLLAQTSVISLFAALLISRGNSRTRLRIGSLDSFELQALTVQLLSCIFMKRERERQREPEDDNIDIL